MSGFSDKACLLLETVAQTLFDPAQYLTEGAVERQSELLKRQYSNANLKASDAAASCRLLAIAPMRHSSSSKLTALLGEICCCLCTQYKAYSIPFIIFIPY